MNDFHRTVIVPKVEDSYANCIKTDTDGTGTSPKSIKGVQHPLTITGLLVRSDNGFLPEMNALNVCRVRTYKHVCDINLCVSNRQGCLALTVYRDVGTGQFIMKTRK